MSKARFRFQGVTEQMLLNHTGATATITNAIPAVSQDITVPDEFIPDVISFAKEKGFVFVEMDPPTSTAVSAEDVQFAALTSTSTAIPVASGWTDVAGLAVTTSTMGGTKAALDVRCAPASILVGAEVRVLATGGAFAGSVVGVPVAFPAVNVAGLLFASAISFQLRVDIPTTATRTSYTFKIQARGVGVLASVSLAPQTSSISLINYRAN